MTKEYRERLESFIASKKVVERLYKEEKIGPVEFARIMSALRDKYCIKDSSFIGS